MDNKGMTRKTTNNMNPGVITMYGMCLEDKNNSSLKSKILY